MDPHPHDVAHEPPAIDTTSMWFSVKLPLKVCTLKELANFSITKEELDALYMEAQQAVDEESHKAQTDRRSWYLQEFRARGTTHDKIAAAALKLSEADFMFHSDSFTILFDCAKENSHNFEAAVKALTAVWPKLLPPRPLKKFAAQYFATLPSKEYPEKRKRVLCYWYIEDLLKRTYAQFLSLAEQCLKTRLVARRECWLDCIGKLLPCVAEGRQVTVSLVVSKLGDTASSIVHKAYHTLLDTLSESSANQSTIMTELEKMVFSKNSTAPAERCCINVMNQLVFNKDERKLAFRCVQVYLTLFRKHATLGTVDQSVISSILTGLRRAFPYAGSDFSVLEGHLEGIFSLCHNGPFLQRVQALALVDLLRSKGWTTLEDRFHRALYDVLLVSPRQVPNASQLTVFFTMLYKSMRDDKNSERVVSFVHRLLQRALYHVEAFACAVLLLVAEVSRVHPLVRDLFRQQPQADGAALGEDDEEEHFVDADKAATVPNSKPEKKAKAQREYSPTARDPQYARGRSEAMWTVNLLAHHTHPTVVKLAVLLLLGEDLSFDVHPLDDISFANFLDMFVENDAKEDREQGADGTASTATRLKGVPVFRRAVHVPSLPHMTSPEFIAMAPEDVDVSALFLHRFVRQRERFVASQADPSAVWEGRDAAEPPDAATALSGTNSLFGPSATKKKNKKKAKKEQAAEPPEPVEDSFGDVEDQGEFDDDFDAEPTMDWAGDEDDDLDSAELSLDEGAEAFAGLMEKNKEAPSKKRQREEEWLDRATSTSSRRPKRGGR